MNKFLLIWFSLSLSGSIIALLLVLLKPLLHRFNRNWQYYIWLLVLLRLLIPFSPDISMINSLFTQVRTQFSEENYYFDSSQQYDLADQDHWPEASLNIKNSPQTELAAAKKRPFWRGHLLGGVWLIVASILLIRKLYGYQQLMKAVKKESVRIPSEKLAALWQKATKNTEIGIRIPVYENPFILAPMLVGFYKPRIILPSNTLDSIDCIYILQHEMVHYRRKDFLYKWLAELTVCLHWFNPAVYLIRRQINRECELSCDESVISHMNVSERQSYGETLLNSISLEKLNRNKTGVLSFSEDAKLLKERLNAIMSYHRKTKWTFFITAIMTFVLICGSVYAGAYKAPAKELMLNQDSAAPIQIQNKSLAPNEKISLGRQYLSEGTACTLSFSFHGGKTLQVYAASDSGEQIECTIENGMDTSFSITKAGSYQINIMNSLTNTLSGIYGLIGFEVASKQVPSVSNNSVCQKPAPEQAFTYESVELRRYEGESGHPYIHNVKTNHTTKEIVGCQRGMLAFDQDGNPLKIDWWSIDTDLENEYYYLFVDTSIHIAPGETNDVYGGWSLNLMGDDSSVDQITYILYCDKEVTFSDGSIWKNPDYENWLNTYRGKTVSVNLLKNYYPYVQTVRLP